MRRTTDNRKKKIAPIVITVLVILYVLPLMVMVLMAMGLTGSDGLMVTPVLLGYLVLGGAVMVGVVRALEERLREIDGGEEDDAKRY